MFRPFTTIIVVALLVTCPVVGHGEVTWAVSRDEFKCQARVERSLTGQAVNHARSVPRCEQEAEPAGGPFPDCEAPAYGSVVAQAVGRAADNSAVAVC